MDLQKWVYEFSKDSNNKNIQGITEATKKVSDLVTDAVNILTGISKRNKDKVAEKNSVSNQQRYIAALGDKPFASLYDIIQSVKKLSSNTK